jgi:hypothetical protein
MIINCITRLNQLYMQVNTVGHNYIITYTNYTRTKATRVSGLWKMSFQFKLSTRGLHFMSTFTCSLGEKHIKAKFEEGWEALVP